MYCLYVHCMCIYVLCMHIYKVHTYASMFIYISYGYVYILIGEGNGTPLQCSCLENPMGGGAWWAAVHGVAKSWIRLSDFTFHFHASEKEMATHSSVLAWRIPETGELGGLLSMGLHRVRHNLRDLAAAAAYVLMYVRVYVSVCSVSKSCSILCDPMDCSPPDSSVHGILHAILEWVTISIRRGTSEDFKLGVWPICILILVSWKTY